MTSLPQDLRLAFRFLRRNPTFTLTAVAMLALGISLTAALFAIVRGTLIEPWPYRGYDRIVTVAGNYPAQGRTDFSLWSVPEIDDLADSGPFEHVIAGDARNVNLTYAGRPERVRAAVITPNAFEMLAVPALLGRTLTASDADAGAAPVVVVSYRFWQTRLGEDPAVVGRTLRIGDGVYTIAGVMPEPFVFWDRDLWMPLRLDHQLARTDRRYYVQAQLRPGVTPTAAMLRLREMTARRAERYPEVPEYAGMTITLRSLVENVLRDLRPTLYVLLGAVALVLLVTTANLANATLAKAMSREAELAVRRAIGGSTAQLARQLLVETGAIGLLGGLTGAAAAAFLLPQILSLIPFGYVPAEAHVELDWRIVAAATAAAVGCGLLIGVLPAIRAAAVDPGTVLKRSGTRTGSVRSHRWRDTFIVAQLTLAIVVLGAAAAATASLGAAVGRDPGYQADDIWTARIALPARSAAIGERWQTYRTVLERLAQSGAVTDAAMASTFPVGAMPTALVSDPASGGAQDRGTLEAAILSVSPSFFRLVAIPMTEGRTFADTDTESQAAVAIVSRSLAARLWPRGSPVGMRVQIATDRATVATVVGVAGDVAPSGSDQRIQPAVFVPMAQQPPAAVVVGLKTHDLRRAPAILDAAVRSVDPDIPVYGAQMLRQSQIADLGPRLLAVYVLGLFGVTVLAVSSLGLYAVISQSVQERRQELRIRLTFGAEPLQLFRGEMTRAGRLIVISTVGGAAGALGAMRAIAATVAGFTQSPLAPTAVSTAILVALALGATAIPAWRAVRSTDPGA